ncbi:MAG: InlB B-repeat-containing protein [Spirochaetaceae bacterium]|nr:InlB B-repeat-containing protein [Spirochaetaceae bacterium]
MVPNEQVSGLSIFRFKTDYSNTTLAAVDVEGVSSSTLTSGQAIPPATYVIKYDANGATGGSVPSPQYKTQYKDITLATNDGNLTRIGYRFSGWNTSPDGTGDDYAEGATYSADESVTLYADWTEVTDVTFNRSSGSVDHGDDVIIYPPAGAIIYYRTDEGATWENGTQDKPVTIKLYNEKYKPQNSDEVDIGIPEGGSVTITAYARYADGTQSEVTSETYSLNKYTVSYDGNGNSYGNIPSPETFFSGKKVQLASQDNLRRSGYSFGGWNTADDGSGKTYAAGSEHVFTGDTNLYAVWNPMTEFFVSSSSTNDSSNDGSQQYPFGTVDKAVFYINEINDGTQSFIIHVEGTYTATEDDVKNDNTSVVNIAPDKTLTLTIQGKDGQTATINANNHGRVMYVGGKANVTLKNIELIGGVVNGFGGGVYIAGGTLTMKTGSSIKNNTANDQGGGVYIAGGTFTMETGSSINGNTASSQGGGVFINNGEFNMTGGTINGNTVTNGNGGGVFVKDTASTFNMSGGTISGNTATQGGGVYNDGTFNISGSAIVNTNNDVYLPSGKTITVDSALTGSFPVATITPQTYTFNTQVLSGSRVDKEFGLFKVTEDSSGEKWGVAATGMLLQYTSAVDATNVLQNLVGGKSVSFDMTSDTQFTPHDTYPEFGSGTKSYAIHVPDNTTLVINGNGNTLNNEVYCGDLFSVAGTLVLNDVKITDTDLHGTVIQVRYGAMVILNNCIIEKNQCGVGTALGVIDIENGGTVIMNGGKIEENYLVGVDIYNGGSFTIKGGGVIQNNDKQNNGKGGVRKKENATYVNEGGTVDKVEDY